MTRSSPTLRLLLGVPVFVPLLALAGCAAEDPAGEAGPSGSTSPAGVGGGTGSGGSTGEGAGPAGDDDVLVGPCPLGAVRECRVHNDVGCLTGAQYCVDGVWSECKRNVNRGGSARRALSDAAEECGASDTTENVCDAACQAISPDEIPDFGEGGSSIVDWVVGTLGDLTEDMIEEGLIEPCNNERDCEFDHYCEELTGTCIPYAPGQTNPLCGTDYDVTAGIPCDGNVVMCNRGGSAIPEADIEGIMEIKYREPGNPISSNTYWMDGCSLAGEDGTCAIEVDGDLEPGDCVQVPCDVPDGYTVFIDAGFGNSEECDCGNNWSVNAGGSCSEPVCGGDVGAASDVPVTLLLAIDVSRSMDDSPNNPTRMETVRDAMVSFVDDASSEGLGVVLRYWPAKTWSDDTGRCTGDSTCDGDAPFVARGTCSMHPCNWRTSGTGAANRLSSGCTDFVAATCAAIPSCCSTRWTETCAKRFDQESGGACSACDHPSLPKPAAGATDFAEDIDGYHYTLPDAAVSASVAALDIVGQVGHGTPSYPALEGAVDYCRQYEAAHPGEECVVVFATDGDPGGDCNNDEGDIFQLAEDGFDDGIYTYAIGIDGSNEDFINSLADAGGTTAGYILGSGAQAEEDFREALNNIRNTFGCSYTVPDDTDPALVTVEWNRDSGDTPLTEVDSVDDCGAGAEAYYFDSATELILCPDTCEAVRADSTSVIELAIACEVTVTPLTFNVEFTAEGECDDPGTFPKWTLLLYSAEVPDGSSIEVRAATKLYADDADFRDQVDVVEIESDNETSDMDDPTRLDTPLGNDAFGEVLQLEFESTVGGGAPDLIDYEVQFTCAPTE